MLARCSAASLRPILLFFAIACGCDDAPVDGFEVRIEPTRTEGNAPLPITFDARHTGPLEHAFEFEWDFGDGETSVEEDPSHTFADPGTYDVSVTVTDAEEGGSGSAELTITVAGPADLQISDVAASPRRTRAGADIDVAFGFKNAGNAVVGPYELLVFLSAARSLDGIVPLSQQSRTDDFAGDAPQGFEETLTLPDDLPSGDYFVGVVADPAELVGDQNRDDNVGFAPFSLEVRNPTDNGPDLTPCSFDVPAFTAASPGQTPIARVGEQLQVQVCFANTGNRPVPQAGYAIFLSADEVHDPGDLEVGRRGGVALGPDDRDTFNDVVDLPLDVDPGTYSLLVVADADDELEEQREDNNERAYPKPFRLAGLEPVEGVDLLVASVEVTGERVFWTQQISGSLVLRNLGDTEVSRAFVVRVFAEPTNGDEPILLSSLNLRRMDAGAEETLDIRATLSRRVPRGDYRISACADPTNSTDDVNRGNNCRTLQRILDLGGDPDFDPRVEAVGFSPPALDAGDMLSITATIANGGLDPTGPIDGALLLSPSGRFDDSVVLQRFPLDSVEGGGSVEIERTVAVPLELDQQIAGWRVGVAVDPDNTLRGEGDEENNVAFAPGELTVSGAMGGCAEDAREDNDAPDDAADLPPGTYEGLGACDDADWFEIGVPANQVLDLAVSWDDAEGALTMDLADEAGGVLRGGEGPAGSLALFVAPSPDVRSFLVRISGGGARMQYDLVVALSAQAEGPALRARAVSAAPPVTEAGAEIEVAFELVNVGGMASAPAEIPVAINDAPSLEGAQVLGEIAAPAVAAGGSEAVRGRVSIPQATDDGRYFLLVDTGVGVGVGAVRVDAEQACERDAFEPNGSPHEAGGFEAVAAPVEDGEYEDLRACRGDDDWYAITLGEGQHLEVSIEFDARAGDLDLALYEPDGETLVFESTGLQSTERATLPRARVAGDYLARVYLSGADQVNVENRYSMQVEISDDAGCEDDPFEPNGDAVNARVLPAERNDLVLCPGDEDWFAFNLAAGNVVRFTVNAAGGAVEMTLFDPDGLEVGRGRRNVAHQADLNGLYTLRVATEALESVEYQLEVVGVIGVDVCLQGLTLSRDSGAPGDALRAEVTLCQLRNQDVRDVAVRFLLSEDDQSSADDAELGELVVPVVPGAGEARAQRRLTVPRGAAEGERFIVAVVDPEARTNDLNRRNNEGAASFDVVGACVDDDFRTNEGPFSATAIEISPHEGGVICAHTEDWYVIEIPDAGALTVTLTFEHAMGDLDLGVWRMVDGAPVELDASRTEGDVEEVNLEVPAGALLIEVDGFDDAAAPYTLSWTLP